MTELFTFQMNQTKENHDINNHSIRCNHDVNSNNFVVIEIYSMAKFAKKTQRQRRAGKKRMATVHRVG